MSRQPAESARGLGADLASTVSRVRRVLPIIARRHKVMLVLALVFMVAIGALNTVVPVLFGNLVNRVADAMNEGSGREGVFAAAAPFLFLIGAGYLTSQLLLVGQKWLVEAACTRIER